VKNNTKIITKYWGEINPLEINDYIEVGGYEALKKFIKKMNPEEATEEIKKSGLCGRGGAGFPTGEKWEMIAKEKSNEKYFICNLDESEPGVYKDRAICENNPHLLLEGIIISALAVGAQKAFIYVNGNYKREIEILERALKQSQEKFFLGEKILGSKYNLDVELFFGAGAYVCGEETALINSLEGRRGEPKLRPPYPSEKGFKNCPTAVNNAETLTNVPWIILNGGEKYARIGASCSPGTKLFILSGAVKNEGIIEAPTGATINELICLSGGMKKGKEFWFAQVGGSCGGLFLENELDIELNFSRNCQCPIGSGSILIVDRSVSIYDLLLSWTSFFRRESCGKCIPCREGTFRLWEIAKRFQDGKIVERDKIAIEDILWTLNNSSFCPLGKFAAKAFEDAIKKLNILK
jgi:NADH:ubiquinone oxidoreductase subunit F (NADH-binding)